MSAGGPSDAYGTFTRYGTSLPLTFLVAVPLLPTHTDMAIWPVLALPSPAVKPDSRTVPLTLASSPTPSSQVPVLAASGRSPSSWFFFSFALPQTVVIAYVRSAFLYSV